MAATAAVAQRSSPKAAERDASSATPDLNTLVDRVEQAQSRNRSQTRAYTMTRDYLLFGHDEQQPSSEVVAQVNFVPPDTKTYAITQASGSSRGAKIVNNVLEGESKRAPDYEKNALTRANYDFEYAGRATLDGHACYVLKLLPKRQATDMVAGHAWIDANTYLVRRVAGALAKSPSWWLKSVEVTLTFGPAAGMWLQTATQARADVRIFGMHTLEFHILNLDATNTVAQGAPQPAPAHLKRPAAIAGEAVYIRH